MPAQGSDLIVIERGGTVYKLTLSEVAALLSGGLSVATVEVDLGTPGKRSGSFQITGLSGLTPGAPVVIQKAAGPYTGKGTCADEAEMDLITATGKVVTASVIEVYWQSKHLVRGNIKFNYMIGV